MKTDKMLKRLADILDAERHAQLAKYKSLKKVLKALRVQKKKLEKKLPHAVGEEAQHEIESRLKIIFRERQKGLTVLKELKKERKQPKG